MKFRAFVLVTHRWLGLGSAIVLAIVGGTGAFMVLPRDRRPLKGVLGKIHETLLLGRPGHWLVIAVTALSVLLALGGLILWWKRKVVKVRTDLGWRRAVVDFHHSLGALAFVVMAVLAVSGIGLVLTTPQDGAIRRIMVDLHTTRGYSAPIKLIYVIGTLAFVAQGVTGVVMWWRPRRAAPEIASRTADEPPARRRAGAAQS